MINVLLVDDHVLFRQGLKGLVEREPDIRVTAEAAGYARALEMLRAHDVRVVVADISMPGRDGIDLIAHIKSINPQLPVLVLSMHDDGEYAARALRSGAAGYVTKASSTEELVSAIRRVASGHSYVCQSVSENLMARFTRTDSATPLHATLSHREFRIFELLVQCQTTSRIAQELSLSVKTVSTHKTRLLRKMGLHHQGELVRYAIEHKLDLH
jgi:DNA-binding NarL/FixJ family response regulator